MVMERWFRKTKLNAKMRRRVAWSMFCASILGFVSTAVGLIAKGEPKTVTLLSWAALIYEGFNGVQISDEE
jgi:hypothetical protein